MSKFKPNQNGAAVRNRPRSRFRGDLAASSAATARATEQLDRASATDSQDASLDEAPGGIQSIGFYAVLLFVFFRFSFLHEFIGFKLNANLHLIILIGGVSYVAWLLSGNAFRALQEKSTWFWLAFVICMTIATATSFWKGGSFPILYEYLETAFPVVLVIPALVTTRPQIGKIVDVMGLACIVAAVLGSLNTDFTSGRMSLEMSSSEIQNPNDFAAHLILMLPALAYWGFRQGRTVVHKVIASAAIALCLRQILSSGSRGALLSLAITSVFLVFFGPKKAKLAILVGVPVMAMVAIPFVPKESLQRLSTLFSSSAAAKDSEAIDSQETRLALLQDSVKFTLEHPLTGVGPGEFMDFQANQAAQNGQRGLWHVTHNAYTQVSSECGLPAFIFYIGALLLTISNLRKVAKTKDEKLAPIASAMIIMYVGFGVCIFFLSLAYTVHILILSGVATSMKLRLSKQIAAQADGASLPASEVVPA